ncbi:Cupredoxin [Hysterangium stoloniferum]|nr:Cupredoxin [Hysterangium stoloniferum]
MHPLFLFALLVPSLVSGQDYGYGGSPATTSAAAAPSAAAGGQLTVSVGQGGLLFTPSAVNASVGDVVVFQFVSNVHSVTQSSFAAPCSPLQGGFNSGLMAANTNFTLAITATSPIYVYCEQTTPLPHCGMGMVFTINAPSQDNTTAFVAAAKALVSSEPSQTGSPASSGVGAVATAPAAKASGAQSLVIGGGAVMVAIISFMFTSS